MSQVIDIDSGYKDLQALFGSIGDGGEISVVAGVLDEPEVAHYAAINEFGAPAANIPERPAFRTSFDTHEPEYVDEMNAGLADMVDAAVAGAPYAAALRASLERLGIQMEDDLRGSILSLEWERNADSTVAKKGFQYPLLDSGRLVATLKHRVQTGYLGGFGQDRAAPAAAEGVTLIGEVP